MVIDTRFRRVAADWRANGSVVLWKTRHRFRLFHETFLFLSSFTPRDLAKVRANRPGCHCSQGHRNETSPTEPSRSLQLPTIPHSFLSHSSAVWTHTDHQPSSPDLPRETSFIHFAPNHSWILAHTYTHTHTHTHTHRFRHFSKTKRPPRTRVSFSIETWRKGKKRVGRRRGGGGEKGTERTWSTLRGRRKNVSLA